MFERLAKLVKTDRVRSWRLDQAARSILRKIGERVAAASFPTTFV